MLFCDLLPTGFLILLSTTARIFANKEDAADRNKNENSDKEYEAEQIIK